jgi:hypothetical protein
MVNTGGLTIVHPRIQDDARPTCASLPPQTTSFSWPASFNFSLPPCPVILLRYPRRVHIMRWSVSAEELIFI